MCGRFSITITPEGLRERFSLEEVEGYAPRYNAAPGQRLPVIREGFALHPWGVKLRSLVINARAETAGQKGLFQRMKRCLVPADGFYEWDGRKQPYRFSMASRECFAFAGLLSEEGFVILTVQANGIVARVHDRMPAILSEEQEQAWLDGSLAPERLAPREGLVPVAVSNLVNAVRNDSPALLEPAEGWAA